MEVRDSQDHCFYRMVRSQKLVQKTDTSFYVENLNDQSPIKITEKQLSQLLLDYYQNPLKDFSSQEIAIQDKEGNFKILTPQDLTKIYQERIRKNNNPIELNKAIRYSGK